MQPERFSVLSILGIRGSPFIWRNDFWLVTNQTLRGWRSDHQKFVRKVFANPKCFIPFSQKHRKIRLKVKWNVHLVFSKIRSETVVKSVYLQRYFSFFPFGKEGPPIFVCHQRRTRTRSRITFGWFTDLWKENPFHHSMVRRREQWASQVTSMTFLYHVIQLNLVAVQAKDVLRFNINNRWVNVSRLLLSMGQY